MIAALYVCLTIVFGPLAFGPFQIRPGEALCVLPLIYAESVPGLYIGCLLANLFSGYGVYDIFLGSLATLIASLLTYLAGRYVKNTPLKVILGGLFPVLCNAFLVPLIWLLAGAGDVAYIYSVLSMLLTESIWIYVLGTILYIGVKKLIGRRVAVMMPQPMIQKKEKR